MTDERREAAIRLLARLMHGMDPEDESYALSPNWIAEARKLADAYDAGLKGEAGWHYGFWEEAIEKLRAIIHGADRGKPCVCSDDERCVMHAKIKEADALLDGLALSLSRSARTEAVQRPEEAIRGIAMDLAAAYYRTDRETCWLSLRQHSKEFWLKIAQDLVRVGRGGFDPSFCPRCGTDEHAEVRSRVAEFGEGDVWCVGCDQKIRDWDSG